MLLQRRGETTLKIICISFPFAGVIVRHSAVFRGLPLRPETQRETPENLDSPRGGPDGIRTRVYGPPRARCSELSTSMILIQQNISRDLNSEVGSNPSPLLRPSGASCDCGHNSCLVE